MSPADEPARQREVDKFFHDLQGELLGFLLNMGLDPVDAEDVLNECFLVIWRYWHKLRDSNPRAYLYTVARNLIKELWHTRGRRPEHLTGDPPAAITVDQAVIGVDFTQQVVDWETMRWALKQIPEREREAVLLRHYLGYNLAETAVIMKVRRGTVKGYAGVGLKRLRALTIRGEGTR
jgi:RNA polymerase sigma factor (sigma-70 family)